MTFKNMKIYASLSFFLLLIVLGGYFLFSNQNRPETQKNLQISQDVVRIDFQEVLYFPYLKSKIWFSRNIADVKWYDQSAFLDEIWPGIMCNNIEFDQWFKNPSDLIHPALQTLPNNPSLRPKILFSQPTDWLREYETMIGDKNISILLQLTWAPAQYQVLKASEATRHPTPTNIPASAALISDWTAWENHSYPIKWSLWNEPGHTLNAIDRFEDSFGNKIYEGESKEAFELRQEIQKEWSAEIISEMYEQYEKKMRETIHPYSQFWLASFLGIDFSPHKLNKEGKIYFKYFIDAFEKISNAPVDFLTFNSFWGWWVYELNGARNVLGTENKYGPIILTQYAPSLLKESEESEQKDTLDPMLVTLEMMKDIFQFERATDLQHVCLSYWFWKEFWILKQNKKDFSLEPNYSYQALKLFSKLPTTPVRVDFQNSGLWEKAVHIFAWINYAQAAVFFINESSESQDISLAFQNLPENFLSSPPRLEILKKNALKYQSSEVNPSHFSLPPLSIALLSYDIPEKNNPLDRRNSLNDTSTKTRFLQTRSFTDRKIVPCQENEKNPWVELCAENTGSYGFYDSVRSIAYLWQWSGTSFPKVLNVYENLPQKIYINSHFLSGTGWNMQGSAWIFIKFHAPNCNTSDILGTITQKEAETSNVRAFDVSSFSIVCSKNTPIEFEISMQWFTLGSQAEIYLSASEQESHMISEMIDTSHFSLFPQNTEEKLVVPDWELYKNQQGE